MPVSVIFYDRPEFAAAISKLSLLARNKAPEIDLKEHLSCQVTRTFRMRPMSRVTD